MPVITLKEYPGAILYTWWCPRCGCDHYSPYCPFEAVTDDRPNGYQTDYYDVCPHCGQLKEAKPDAE